MLVLGIDIGSSSAKVSIFDAENGLSLASDFFPKKEMAIRVPHEGWAEQNPDEWFNHIQTGILSLKQKFNGSLADVKAIGITYQMHGLVTVDKAGKLIRDSIIWCDSRAVQIGDKAFHSIGEEYCLNNLLNSPGNFTASKLRWIKENEPENYKKIHKIMLPGDYIAYRLTGEITTTKSGLSEGIFWDFGNQKVSESLINYYGFDKDLLPATVPTFGIQGYLTKEAAHSLGITAGIPVAYRAGDQPNNAFSLNVLNPGEIAATAGTSGVVYGITDQQNPDVKSRVNTFLHVNNTVEKKRYGVLLCINGTGILNSWMKHNIMPEKFSYEDMNALASGINPGSDGLMVFPFGNGAERILENIDLKANIYGLDLNIHTKGHLLRASQEGIVFALNYGVEILRDLGLEINTVKAAMANMFLSDVFRQTFATVTGANLEFFNTDGSQGAARGAALGCGFYKNTDEAFKSLEKIKDVFPEKNPALLEAYENWKTQLKKIIRNNKSD